MLSSPFSIRGPIKIGSVMRLVSRSVMTGFVNALAILIFMGQLLEFKDARPIVYVMIAAGLAIIYILPRFTKALQSPLAAIVLLTTIALVFKREVRRVWGRKKE